MVGQEKDVGRVLDEARLAVVVERALGDTWRAEGCQVKPAASNGITGFLGDHFRVALAARDRSSGRSETLHLFVKCLPLHNKDKADFIHDNNFNKRESAMYSLFEQLGGDEGPNAWRPKAYLCEETVLVMPDLSLQGFAPRPPLHTLGAGDALLAAAAVARLHAATANYATCRTHDPLQPYNFLDEYGHILNEPTLCDSLWLRAAAKLSANIINTFSNKYKGTIQNLEGKLVDLYIGACDSLKYHSDTFNTIIHKDLWMNNILFAPGRAVLVDYQCVRCGPPAFDLMMFLCLCTTREFRDKHETEVCLHYYSEFWRSLDARTAARLRALGYDKEEFLRRCAAARALGLVYAVGIFPYVLMEPGCAARVFDDPATFRRYCDEDRSPPVLAHARASAPYRLRQLHATEELIERYLLN